MEDKEYDRATRKIAFVLFVIGVITMVMSAVFDAMIWSIVFFIVAMTVYSAWLLRDWYLSVKMRPPVPRR